VKQKPVNDTMKILTNDIPDDLAGVRAVVDDIFQFNPFLIAQGYDPAFRHVKF